MMLIWMQLASAFVSPMIPLWFVWIYDPMWKRMT